MLSLPVCVQLLAYFTAFVGANCIRPRHAGVVALEPYSKFSVQAFLRTARKNLLMNLLVVSLICVDK